jgi:tRNA(Ile2)-agmatinylcytidine synthase
MDKKFLTTFHNYDYQNNHVCISPASPCPVLYGIRGTVPSDLISALRNVKSEPIDRWLLFLTNQGTDEHLRRCKISDIEPYRSVIVRGRVLTNPRTIRGGHVVFRITDNTGEIDCTTYEPSKQFRNVVKKLYINDIITVYGSVRDIPRTINLEKIQIHKLSRIRKKVENPICKICGKHMKSMGTNRGYRCKKCGTKSVDVKYIPISRDLEIGKFYLPPVSSRRHLSKPLFARTQNKNFLH